ncbi:SymE family type I addiction module toxin [Kluyvera sp. CHPC 1.2972]|uniref:SymE family type I addiction module toxin n=1 Tax=Kluyvera sp. CHPC 1.2972 TaxID=2995176 RepID=UPI002FD7F164
MATIPTQTHPSSTTPIKTERRYTVSYVPQQGNTSTPALNLSGKWLKEAGFDTGTGVTVKIAGDCIVLIPDNDEMKALREEIKQMKKMVNAVKEGVLNAL